MSAQDNTEKVLRGLHVLLSKSEPYPKQPSKVIVDKQQMLDLLTQLNKCTYEMMEEYELTKQSRDKAEREFRKRGDEIVWDASRKAEDIYAASVMYTDEALNSIANIIRKANDSVEELYTEMNRKLEDQVRVVKGNQSELKSQLQDLVDTEKYLQLIEERNKEIAKQKKEGTEQPKENLYANRKTEIKINKEYFEKTGATYVEDLSLDEENVEEKIQKQKAEVKVDLDAEYFQWKENGGVEASGNKKEKDSGSRKPGGIPSEIQKVINSLTSGKK